MDLLNHPMVPYGYFAVLLVVVLVILYKVWKPSKEGLIGSGVVDQVFTSGATMRRLGQEFTSTNQGDYSIIHNAELKELTPGLIPRKSEGLVSERGEPDFWTISSELDAYRSRQSAQMQQQAAAAAAAKAAGSTTEYMARDSVGGQVEDQLLTNYLYR